jgi:hypothetical protein
MKMSTAKTRITSAGDNNKEQILLLIKNISRIIYLIRHNSNKTDIVQVTTDSRLSLHAAAPFHGTRKGPMSFRPFVKYGFHANSFITLNVFSV